jgi:uncharacterized protein (TIGR03437 family)
MRGCLVRWILPVFVCAGSLTAQAPQINAVLNGASFDQSAQAPPVAPGSIVSIFGAALAGTATTPVSMDASMNIPLETSLGGPSRASVLSPVSVTFDGVAAPLFALIRTATFDQINAQIPWGVDVTDGKVQVVVTRDGQAGGTVEFSAADASPGIFTLQFGPGPAIVTNVAFAGGPAVVNGSFAQPQGSVCTTLGLPPGCGVADEPAPVGGAVTIWSNGLGPVDVPVESGNIPTTVGPGGFVAAVKPVRVFIGGVQAQVIGAALHSQFVALNQVNVIVPNVPAGNAVPVQIEIDLNPGGTVRSRGDATMAVRAAP